MMSAVLLGPSPLKALGGSCMQGIRCRFVAAALVAALLPPLAAAAEDEKNFSVEQLDQMLAPIALHPDALLSQMLMAATYPTDVAEAVEWSAANPDQDGDAAVEAVEGEAWDPSVKSLVAFPQVLAMMGDHADWVKDVGDAFLAEPNRVMDRIQYLRNKANEAGYLENNEQQTVTFEDPPPPEESAEAAQPQTVVIEQAPPQTIVIQQTNPQVVFVPAYNPTVVFGVWWWPMFRPWFWHPVGWGFHGAIWRGVGFGIGVGVTRALWGGFHWSNRSVNINVNRFNSINVNNRINSGNRNVNWNHNPERRRDAAYRDGARSRDAAGTGDRDRAGDRQDFRGRESQRDAAQRALSDRGVDPARGRDQLRNDPGTRDRAQAAARDMNRGQGRPSAGTGDRSRPSAGGDRGVAGTGDRSQARAQAQQRERSRTRETANSRGRDSALSGVGRSSGNRQVANRGNASRGSARGRGSGGGGRGGGGRRR